MTKTTIALFLALLVLAACASGPVSGPVLAGVAGSLAVIDQLLASGVIEPAQHDALVGGIQALQGSVAAVQHAQAGNLTSGEVTTVAGGATAAAVAIVQTWRKIDHSRAKAARGTA